MDEMGIELSIIVPIYNVQNYVENCLKSILTYSQKNMEVICIDDASTDQSIKIVQDFKKKDDRIRVYCNSENRGLSYTRNRGMELARGQYILFVDADDMLKEDAVSYLLEITRSSRYDIVFFNYSLMYESKNVEDTVKQRYSEIKNKYEGEWKGIDLFCKMIKNREFSYTACTHLYRRQFLANEQIHFTEGIYHEDIPFVFITTLKARTIYYTDKECYIWFRRSNSITTMEQGVKHLEGRCIGLRQIIKFILETDCLDKGHYDILAQGINMLYREIVNRNNFLEDTSHVFEKDIENRFLFDVFQTPKRKIIKIKQSSLQKLQGTDHLSIYGDGKVAQALLELTGQMNIVIDYIVVTDNMKKSEIFYGHKIYKIKEVGNKLKEELVCIAVAEKHQQRIYDWLKCEGYQKILCIEYEKVNLI